MPGWCRWRDGRGCAKAGMPTDEPDPAGRRLKPGGLADRPDAHAKCVAPVGCEGRRWIMAASQQRAAEAQNGCRAGHHHFLCGGGIGADQLGADGITSASRLRRALMAS